MEQDLRQRIFERLEQEVAEKGSLTREELTHFHVDGHTYRLIDRNKGIWNPQGFAATLSILSKPDSPYADMAVGESLYAYDYRAGNVNGDNTKLRRAFELELPVILLRWISIGSAIRYVPVFPVFVVADNRDQEQFILALDQSLRSVSDPSHLKPIERVYAQRVQKQRLHQPEFRGRVLLAYRNRCTVCYLGHAQLLDAAHIISDGKPHGTAEVANGLSMCKIHHAAYDANLLGISPAYQVHIGALLMEDHGTSPTLQHALQGIDSQELNLPHRKADRPSRERLAERFSAFQSGASPVHSQRIGTIDIARPAMPLEVSRSLASRRTDTVATTADATGTTQELPPGHTRQ
ncbi:HNH endonuclease [Nocardia sp. NPDC005366]|uniref:HNH endonuclease n=1 Tax=Nocardia sp. NPDC005366 TaxID=3156878 RepID=UPI0033AB9519